MAWEENSCISLNMQLIAILSRIGVLDYYPRLQKYSIFPNYASTTSHNYGAAGCFFNPLENTYGEQKPTREKC